MALGIAAVGTRDAFTTVAPDPPIMTQMACDFGCWIAWHLTMVKDHVVDSCKFGEVGNGPTKSASLNASDWMKHRYLPLIE
jgi:hypothetical protein